MEKYALQSNGYHERDGRADTESIGRKVAVKWTELGVGKTNQWFE